MFNATVRGWINYYGCYYKSALYPTLRHIDRILARWLIGSSNLYGAIGGERSSGLPASRGDSRRCLRTGGCYRGMAEQWEPDEVGASRPVLRAWR
jgi:Group II intron, maturase-specific domain